MYVISNNIYILSILSNLTLIHSWTEPLNNISMVLSSDINNINVSLIEMSMFVSWNFVSKWVFINANVHLDSVISKVNEELVDNFSFLSCQSVHILLFDFFFFLSIEPIEERSEMSIFCTFDNSCDSSTWWLILLFQESLTNDESIFLLLKIGSFTNPNIDLVMKF